MKKIVLMQPRMGFLGEFVKHPPLSLLFLSSELVKKGYEVKIIDNRVLGNNWRSKFNDAIDDDTVLFGCTVMTGTPIKDSIEASKLAKEKGIPVVWGGAHPTCLPEQTLKEEYIDYVVSGYGSVPIYKLAEYVSGNGIRTEDIEGLSYKENGKILQNQTVNNFEIIPWKDIPYNIIEDYAVYRQLDHADNVFPIYSVFGCPYQCTFCISPVRYKSFSKKWIPLPANDIVDHIEYLKDRFGATFIYFYDEDSFVDIGHIKGVLGELRRRNVKIKLGFRGARIDEIDKMDDTYISQLADAGTNILHIGMESGSQKILDLYKKNIKVSGITQANKKLANNKNIIPFYNWIVGAPTEDIEDLKLTKKLILKLVEDNPKAIIPSPNLFQPLPGTSLYDVALNNGYVPPQNLEDWINLEQNVGDFENTWISKESLTYIKMLYIASFFVDRKLDKVIEGKSPLLRSIKYFSIPYYPIIRLRLKYDFSRFLIEYYVFKFLGRLLTASQR